MNAKNANIVIIGGGVIGTSTAFHLAEAGHEDIVLLDSGPIANGTTQFAAGQTAYLTSHKNAMPFSLYCTPTPSKFPPSTLTSSTTAASRKPPAASSPSCATPSSCKNGADCPPSPPTAA